MRLRLLLVLLLAAPAWAEDDGAAWASVRLVPERDGGVLRRAYALPEGRTAVATPPTWRAPVGGAVLRFVDVDGNGRLDDVGVDGWCLADAVYALPFETPLLVGEARVEVRFEAEPPTLRTRVSVVDAPREQRLALRHVNTVRARNGLPPVDHDAALSEGCRLHCLYCDLHGLTHEEVPGEAGYTEAGARTGPLCNAASGRLLDRAGALAYRSFYHRRAVMDPRTRAMGFGAGARHVAVDGLTNQAPRAWVWPLILPAPGTADQPRAYDHGEMPHPVPPKPEAGLPITLTWPAGTTFEKVEAHVETARRGAPVAAHVSWPGKPASDEIADNHGAICIIPAEVLAPRTTYRVRVAARVDGAPFERTFEFRTAAR